MRNPLYLFLASLFFGLAFGAEPEAGIDSVKDKFGQTVPISLDQTVTEARRKRLPYFEGDYDIESSIELLSQVVQEKDDYFRAWFNLGLAYWQASGSAANHYEEAKQAFERAIAIRDAQGINDISVFNSAGWVSLNAGDYPAAEHFLLRGLKDIDSGSEYTKEAVYSNLGRLYFFTQRLDDAVYYSRIAVDEYGNDGAAAETLRLVAETQELQQTQKAVQAKQESE